VRWGGEVRWGGGVDRYTHTLTRLAVKEGSDEGS